VGKGPEIIKRMPLKNFSFPKTNKNIYLLKTFDGLFGPTLVRFCSYLKIKKGYQIVSSPKNILIIRPGGIGDAVLLLPMLNFLNMHFPACRISILAERRNAGVFQAIPYLKRPFLYHKVDDLYKVLRHPYDIVIDTEQWHRLSAIVAFFTKAQIRIGFATNERAHLFTHAIPYSHNEYEVFSFLMLLEPLIGKIKYHITKPFFPLPHKFTIELKKNVPWVALFPGASIKERKWPKDRFREVARWLDKKGIGIVVVGGRQDKKIADYIVDDLKRHINLAGRVSLLETAQILAQTKLLLTTDSGIMHLSVAVGTPVVALFGPGIEEKWAPRDGRSIVINKNLPCSPCTRFGYTPPCPYDAQCMKEISVDEVKEAINAILAKTIPH